MRNVEDANLTYRLSITVKAKKGIELYSLVLRDLDSNGFHRVNQNLQSYTSLILQNQKDSAPQLGTVIGNARMVYVSNPKAVKFIQRADVKVMEGSSSVRGFFPSNGYKKAYSEFEEKVQKEGLKVK